MARHLEEKDLEKLMLTAEQVQQKVEALGAEISRDYAGKDLLLLSVLKGSVIFMADLMRAITIPAEIDFMAVSSYGSGTKSSGVVRIIKDIEIDLEGKEILIVEDILDSGATLSYLKELLLGRNPSSVKVVTLLDKPSRRKADIRADYVGFEVPDEFLVGYGLDYAEKYRNLPDIGVLKPEIYTA
ncbi:hypoxanthine phosphoribosyltransferase [Ruminococcaceae bacterium OttesenSCG-928-D13]|nr:hypoxanthine phosphoribosyltransferase [Ruminococcaceae bacterium OttesenSCG-928-D13]